MVVEEQVWSSMPEAMEKLDQLQIETKLKLRYIDDLRIAMLRILVGHFVNQLVSQLVMSHKGMISYFPLLGYIHSAAGFRR